MPSYTLIQLRSASTEGAGTRVHTTGRHPTMSARALMAAALLMSLPTLAPLVPGRAWAQAASFHIVSDGTAKYSYTEEPGWETLGFDDSAWSFVVAPSKGLCFTPPVPPGEPNFIWGEDPQEFQTIFVRKTFTLEAAATAHVMAGADDDYDLFINGEFIGGNHDGFANEDRYTNVLLRAGLNVLAMRAIDVVGGCQSVIFNVLPPTPPVHPVGGSVTALRPHQVRCENIITGQAVEGGVQGTSWNCEALGLTVLPGDRVSMLVEGIVSAKEMVNAELAGITKPGTTIDDPTPVPNGPAGTLSFTSEFCNIGTTQLTELASVTTSLTGGNVLLNRDPGTPPRVGSALTFSANRGYADRVLDPRECVDVLYTIGLAQDAPFDFFVDVVGMASESDTTRAPMRVDGGRHRRGRSPRSIGLIQGHH